MRKIFVSGLSFSLFGLIASMPAFATSPGSASKPEMPIALKMLSDAGAQIVYIGDQGGVYGYFVRSKHGRVETMYVWPDGRNLVTGAEFNADGDNVTTTQIKDMQNRFDSVEKNVQPKILSNAKVDPSSFVKQTMNPHDLFVFKNMVKNDKIFPMVRHHQQTPMGFVIEHEDDGKTLHEDVYVTPDGKYLIAGRRFLVSTNNSIVMPAVNIQPVKKAVVAAKPIPMPPPQPPVVKKESDTIAKNGLPYPPPPEPRLNKTSKVQSSGINGPVPVQQDISRKVFYQHSKQAAWFGIGNSKSPVVWFVADPAANLSHQAWRVLSPMIKANKIAVKVVLVDGSSESEKMNLAILSSKNPAGEFISAMDGKALPTPNKNTPNWRKAIDWLNYNWKFAHDTGITGTPVLAYMGKDHHFHSAQEPASVRLFLQDVP